MKEPQPDVQPEKIERLLENFQPQPGERFYRRMARAPWVRAGPRTSPASTGTGFWSRRRALAITSLAFVLLIAGFFATPAGRGVAQRLLNFFAPAESDHLALQLTAQPADMSDPGYFNLSIEEAERLAGFKLSEIPPVNLPATFSGAHYDPTLKSVIISYTSQGYTLLFAQWPADAASEISSIGASAPVEQVSIGDDQGEYVAGGWRVTNDLLQSATENEMDIVWDPHLPQQILRWQRDGIRYEIITLGRYSPNKDSLIQIAASIPMH